MNRRLEGSVCKPRREAAEETNSAYTLIRDFQLPSLGYFVIAA